MTNFNEIKDSIDALINAGTIPVTLLDIEAFRLLNDTQRNRFVSWYLSVTSAIHGYKKLSVNYDDWVLGDTALNTPLYITESEAYFDEVIDVRGGTVSDTRKAKIDAFITYAKRQGWWYELDVFCCLKNTSEEAALTCLKKPTRTIATLENSTGSDPVFAVEDGIEFTNGDKGYINTQFTPSTQALKMTQDSTLAGSNIRSAVVGAAAVHYDIYGTGGATKFLLAARFESSGTVYADGYVNSDDIVALRNLEKGDDTAFVVKRDAGRVITYNAGELNQDSTTASTGLPTSTMKIGSNGTDATNDVEGKKDWYAFGSGAIDMEDLVYAVDTFLM